MGHSTVVVNALCALLAVFTQESLFVTCQTCLSSPNELLWTSSGNGFSGSMTFDAKEFTTANDGFPAGFVSRVHDDSIPSPTLRMIRGNTYYVTLNNNLEAESPDNPTSSNVIKDPNTTNIHTHGLHISGEAPSDDIFIAVAPGETYTYTYNIPCDHAGGLFWYHPHHHGSTTLQVAGGAAGLIVIEDDALSEGLPTWYTDMNELLLLVQNMDLQQLGSLYPSSVDYLTSVESSTSYYLVNGIYKPTICMTGGEWMKFRIQHSDTGSNVEMTITGCELYLLGKDGVLIHGSDNSVPRSVSSMFFTVSSRADVAVHCPSDGVSSTTMYELKAGSIIIAEIEVSGTETSATTSLTTFYPVRPYYLENLLDYSGEFQEYEANGNGIATSWSVKLGARTVNGAKFGGETAYQVTISADTVNEWSISGAGAHPFHLHVNHMQVMSGGDAGSDNNWQIDGDWLDTLNAAATVRFRTDRWGGKVIMHCHILEHEDQGAMGIILIDGGCDGEYNDFGSGTPSCDSTCSTVDITPSPVSSPTSVSNPNPTPNPSPNPTINNNPSPTASPIPMPTSSSSCSNTGTSCSDDAECCSIKCKNGSCKGV